jgi:hypothetical protein
VYTGSAVKVYKNGVNTVTDGVDSSTFAASSYYGLSGMIDGVDSFNFNVGLLATYAEWGIVTGADKSAYVASLDTYLKNRFGLS